MTEKEPELDKIVRTRLTRLNAGVSGLVTGVIFGFGVFVATNWLLLKGGDPVGPHLALLGQFFLGYTVSFIGSIVGLLYGFVTGFVLGYSVAFLYNVFLSLRHEPKRRSCIDPNRPEVNTDHNRNVNLIEAQVKRLRISRNF